MKDKSKSLPIKIFFKRWWILIIGTILFIFVWGFSLGVEMICYAGSSVDKHTSGIEAVVNICRGTTVYYGVRGSIAVIFMIVLVFYFQKKKFN